MYYHQCHRHDQAMLVTMITMMKLVISVMVVESEEEEEKVRLLTESAAATPVRVIIIIIISISLYQYLVHHADSDDDNVHKVRRGSAAVVRPSEESTTSSNLPRAGWQVNIQICTFIACHQHHQRHQSLLQTLPAGRCQRPLLAAAACREDLPRDERSSQQRPQRANQALL